MRGNTQSIQMIARPYLRAVDPVGSRDLTLQNFHIICDVFTTQYVRHMGSRVKKAFS